ncbi:MAG: ABC transporter permease, partial [Alphaproteobacteria bacterium]
TTLLFLTVFVLALGTGRAEIGGISFAAFLAPGLAMMVMMQNAFANTSSSLVIAKVQGNIVDLLMPPLSPREVLIALALGGTTRGILVGVLALGVMTPFIDLQLMHPGYAIFHCVAAALLLSLIGIIGGIWSEKFDHIAAVTNFIVTPLTFLSGTFYSVKRLPPEWRFIADLNPFHYMIDGFRYGFIGRADTNLTTGVFVMLGCNLILLVLGERMFATGYKLKP